MKKRKNLEFYLGLIALLSILVSWYIGKKNTSDQIINEMKEFVPAGVELKELDENCWLAIYKGDTTDYYSLTKSKGYSGNVWLLIRSDAGGKITELNIVNQTETPSYFKPIREKNFLSQFTGISIQEDINKTDAVTGSTMSSKAIIKGIEQGQHQLAEIILGEESLDSEPDFEIQLHEIIVIVLLIVVIVFQHIQVSFKKWIRWLTLLSGLLYLGFIINKPINVSVINSFLMGYWPDWSNDLYWLVLILGVFTLIISSGKNPYCNWICPFGAFQEILGAIGNAKNVNIKFKRWLLWFHRVMAWTLILVALIFHNPGISAIEPFGVLFSFNISLFGLMLLALVVITSLFIKRPWCNYLCPMDPVFSYVRMMRENVLKIVKRRKS